MIAIPTLAVTTVPGTPWSGRLTASSSRWLRSTTSLRLSTAPAMTTNSSPPKRPTRSSARTTARRRSPTSRMTSSARSWPSVSLSALSPSRSTNSTEIRLSALTVASAVSSRSKIAAAVGQSGEPVAAGILDQPAHRPVALDGDPGQPGGVLHQLRCRGSGRRGGRTRAKVPGTWPSASGRHRPAVPQTAAEREVPDRRPLGVPADVLGDGQRPRPGRRPAGADVGPDDHAVDRGQIVGRQRRTGPRLQGAGRRIQQHDRGDTDGS